MKLEEFLTAKPEFYLSSKEKTYTLRIPNLEDRTKFKDILGDEANIQKVFNELQWDVIAKLVYRLLEDKSEFTAYQEKGHDDDGVQVTYLVTGPALLMRAVRDIEEASRMLGALVNALRLGDPIVNQAVQASMKAEEKKSLKRSTGEKSLTQSPQSTVTPQSSSVS